MSGHIEEGASSMITSQLDLPARPKRWTKLVFGCSTAPPGILIAMAPCVTPGHLSTALACPTTASRAAVLTELSYQGR
jgi:hypothetical protein